MEARRAYETSVCFETTRRCMPESFHFHTRSCDNLESHNFLCNLRLNKPLWILYALFLTEVDHNVYANNVLCLHQMGGSSFHELTRRKMISLWFAYFVCTLSYVWKNVKPVFCEILADGPAFSMSFRSVTVWCLVGRARQEVVSCQWVSC
jgi:hypothetical protein